MGAETKRAETKKGMKTTLKELAERKQAIKESREHWKRMHANWNCGERPVLSDCACCRKWYFGGCRGCPITAMTRHSHCEGTPYSKAAEHYFDRSKKPEEEWTKKWRALAQQEIDFLAKVEADIDKKIQKRSR